MSDDLSELTQSSLSGGEGAGEGRGSDDGSWQSEDVLSPGDVTAATDELVMSYSEEGELSGEEEEYDDSADEEEGSEEDEFFDGPAEWAEIDEAELEEVALRLCGLGASSAAEAAPRPMAMPAVENDHLDPLGYGRIDLRTMSLIQTMRPGRNAAQRANRQAGKHHRRWRGKGDGDGDGGAALGVRDKAHTDRQKVMLTGEKFDPEVYLAVMHRETSLDELQAGIISLRKGVSERNSQLKDLVKDNFERFISCKNTIDEIHSRLRDSEEGHSTSSVSTQQLAQGVLDLSANTKETFAALLERHRQVERVRNVIGLLRRFSHMFSLPTRIRQHADAHDYEAVISEHRKARQMVGVSQTTIWGRLMKEVDKVVEHVVDNVLMMKLVKYDTAPEEAVDAIKSLLQLREDNAPGTAGDRLADPVGVYLAKQKEHFLEKLEEYSAEHSCKMTNLREKMHERAQEDVRWMELQSNTANESRASIKTEESFTRIGSEVLAAVYDEQDGANGWEIVEVDGVRLPAPQAMIVKFEMRLTATMVRQLGELWLAFCGLRERKASLLTAEISSRAGKLVELVDAVSDQYKATMRQLLADMAPGSAGATPGLTLILCHLAQACEKMAADNVTPLLAHLADIGWETLQHCVGQIGAVLHCPPAWLAEQETFEAVPHGCYSDGDPVSPLPVAIGRRLALANSMLSNVAEHVSAFPAASSSKAQLQRERQVEQQLSKAFYGCMSSCCDTFHKLATRLCSGSSSESSAFSNRDQGDGEEAPRLLLLRNNVAFVREQLLPTSAAALLRVLEALQPATSMREAKKAGAHSDHPPLSPAPPSLCLQLAFWPLSVW
eukprot:CAMPEP_0117694614 /NCGR_PEP_ID=MMETSP0804-20121206/27597_1 /TAXON_ID=1074897 /ORGANISM="Tetraselmis astigmatica, Strain CCMP880" /LENGTH=834 /DNA_ID=CAMNT_0005508425 /DNA_START=472 /DNA_END=2974 /DNA_ORIENTATION=+